ncbi:MULTISPECIES: DUF2474 family protein [unclassified Sphingobium]|nr:MULTISPECIES: DUF2474 family protein [unclassified Sphingobium]MBG6120634.1 hypothetical protein [Sphingobium sp. JAI105]PSO11960.1 DUF2474 domain-containing protein [Sphingobium sp. AEW4]TWD06673.1 uncharacterized protein DUF2474 [Sphingobium sp. AEW010]TWD23606.1 uncharacterized protein DUF2474 [Sphingobium sp. AEW013]TWD26125.1 uncharacterized protein DUF2474 [Sphingobium sp. AEW001]
MRARLVKLGWFVGIWTASVAALLLVSLGLRYWLM